MTREFVGSVFTDVASLLIADPCKVLPSEGDDRAWPTYEDLIDKWEANCQPMLTETEIFAGTGNLKPRRRPSPAVKLLDDAMTVRFGCDGYCHVYVERGENGQVERIIIEPGMCAKEPEGTNLARQP